MAGPMTPATRMQLEENDRANNTRLLKVKDLVLQNAHRR